MPSPHANECAVSKFGTMKRAEDNDMSIPPSLIGIASSAEARISSSAIINARLDAIANTSAEMTPKTRLPSPAPLVFGVTFQTINRGGDFPARILA